MSGYNIFITMDWLKRKDEKTKDCQKECGIIMHIFALQRFMSQGNITHATTTVNIIFFKPKS